MSPFAKRSQNAMQNPLEVLAEILRDGQDLLLSMTAMEEGLRALVEDAGATPLTQLHRIWRTLSSREKVEFLTQMLTPNERRALQFGFEEDAP